MKNLLLTIFLGILISCNQPERDNSGEEMVDSSAGIEQVYVPAIEKTSDMNQKPDFFMISISGTADLKEAVEQVKVLRSKGHPSGYLWMPDYASLSGKEMYAVFIGPFSGIDTTIQYLEHYNKSNPLTYAVKAAHSAERTSIHGKYDIRINNKRQFLILTYSTPEDEEQYFADGGEDWGWFTHDVGEYFRKHYPEEVILGGVFNSWLTPSDIKELKKELGLENFGYVLINGKNKLFVPHDMPDVVIREACGFFKLKYISGSD